MATFSFKHGTVLYVDSVPATDLSGNSFDVNAAGGIPLVAHTPKTAGVQDGFSYPSGTAVYEAVGYTLADPLDYGDEVYWDSLVLELTDTSSATTTYLGKIVSPGTNQTDNLLVVFGG